MTDFTSRPLAAAVYPIWIILVLLWVGATQPRATALSFGLTAAAALGFVLLRNPQASLAVAAVPFTVAIGIGLGEGASVLVRRLARLARDDARTSAQLAGLDALLVALGDATSVANEAHTIALHARTLFGAGVGPCRPRRRRRTVHRHRRFKRREHPGPHRNPVVRPHHGPVGEVFVSASAPDAGASAELSAPVAAVFGRQVGAALESAWTVRRLHREVKRDVLTGTGNRHQAEVILDGLGNGDALLIVDLDAFKSVNDTSGHREGDRLLVALGRFLLDRLPNPDDVARYGGDEFLLVLRAEPNPRQAALDLVQAWHVQAPRTTISVGVAVNRNGEDGRATLDRADAALYRAKASGRDRSAIDD